MKEQPKELRRNGGVYRGSWPNRAPHEKLHIWAWERVEAWRELCCSRSWGKQGEEAEPAEEGKLKGLVEFHGAYIHQISWSEENCVPWLFIVSRPVRNILRNPGGGHCDSLIAKYSKFVGRKNWLGHKVSEWSLVERNLDQSKLGGF